ncbi:hypothetical protein MJM25_23345, partial [Salmonella enterica subsp. enterica serovar Lubbock]|nr:hypothetical protein [Salmonella enterica subsp. enterica serovar Lubbock]
STWPKIDFNINDIFAPVFFYVTGAWLLCVVYRINGWDTGRKKYSINVRLHSFCFTDTSG